MTANCYALLIGLNYTAIPNVQLHGCINDILNMKDMLVETYDYPIENITILRDDITDSDFLPTHSNILAAFEWIILNSKNAEKIWIHYSGHGTQVPDINAFESEKGLGDCIVPCDYREGYYVCQEKIYSYVARIECPVFITIDACHSGSLCELEWSYFFDGRKTQNSQIELSNNNIYMISGCMDNQTSADIYDYRTKDAMGVFTNEFIRCIREIWDKEKDFGYKILELYKKICGRLKAGGYSQTPVLSCSSDIGDSSFLY